MDLSSWKYKPVEISHTCFALHTCADMPKQEYTVNMQVSVCMFRTYERKRGQHHLKIFLPDKTQVI